MKINLIGIKRIGNINNAFIRALFGGLYIGFFFIFFGNWFYITIGGIIGILNVYILKKRILTLKGMQRVIDILDENLFLLFSNIKAFGVFIENIRIKLFNRKKTPFQMEMVEHQIRLK